MVDDLGAPNPRVTYYRPVVARSEIFVPIQLSITPFDNVGLFASSGLFRSISIGLGIGPSLNFGNITSRIDGFELNLRNRREDPLYYEVYYQFGRKAFRTLVFNYTWSLQADLLWRFKLRMAGQGSLGDVTEPFDVFGKQYQVSLKRRGLAFFLIYSFDFPTRESK